MAEAETEGAPEKAKSPVVLILVVALVAAGAGIGGGFVLFNKTPDPAAEAPAEATGEEAAAAEAEATPASYMQRLLQIEPIVVNIEGDGYTRMLKVKLAFECDSPESRDEAELRLPQIQDAVLTLVSSKRLGDLVGFEGKALLKDDLRDRVNHFLTGGQINAVLITEFVVQ